MQKLLVILRPNLSKLYNNKDLPRLFVVIMNDVAVERFRNCYKFGTPAFEYLV